MSQLNLGQIVFKYLQMGTVNYAHLANSCGNATKGGRLHWLLCSVPLTR